MSGPDIERHGALRTHEYSFGESLLRLIRALFVFGVLTSLVVWDTYAVDEKWSLIVQFSVTTVFVLVMALKIAQRLHAGLWAHQRGQQFTAELVNKLPGWKNLSREEAYEKFTELCEEYKRPWSPETRLAGAAIARFWRPLQCGVFNYALRWHYLVAELALVIVFARHPLLINVCTVLIGVAIWVELWQVIAHRLTLGQYHDYFHITVMLHVYPVLPPRQEDVAPSRIDLLRRFLKLWAGLLVATLVGYAGIYAGLHQVNPETFAGVALPPNNPTGRLLHALSMAYFSTITMMTVGYGDIHPITSIAQFAVLSEVIAAFSLAVLLLTLASLAVDPSTGPQPAVRTKRIVVGIRDAQKSADVKLTQAQPLMAIGGPGASGKKRTRAERKAKREAERQARLKEGTS